MGLLRGATQRSWPGGVLLAISWIYALCFVAIKAGLSFAPPLYFGGLRALLGGMALLAFVRWRGESVRPPRDLWPGIAGLGLVATTLTYGAMFLSPGRTGAGIASVLGNLQPLFAIAFGAMVLRERPTGPTLVGLAIGLAGVTLIALPALVGPEAYGVPGAVLAIAASAGTAGGSVIAKRLGREDVILTISAWQLLVGSLPLLALSLVVEGGVQRTLSLQFVVLVMVLAILGTALPTALWFVLVQHYPVGQLTLALFLVPAFGLAVATIAFREPITVLEILGAGLTVAVIAPMARIARQQPHSPPPAPQR